MNIRRTLNDIYVDALATMVAVAIFFGLLWGAHAFAASPTPPQVAECRNFEGDIIPCSWLMPRTDEDRRKDCHTSGCTWRYFDNFCYSTYPQQCGECICESYGTATDTSTMTSIYAPGTGGTR
jgi:hypothetical protein